MGKKLGIWAGLGMALMLDVAPALAQPLEVGPAPRAVQNTVPFTPPMPTPTPTGVPYAPPAIPGAPPQSMPTEYASEGGSEGSFLDAPWSAGGGGPGNNTDDRYYVTVDYLIWTRDLSHDGLLGQRFAQAFGTGDIAPNIHFGWQGSPNVTVGIWCDDGWAYEAAYLGFDGINAKVGAQVGNSFITTDYDYRMHSVELNARKFVCPEFSLLAGLRYVYLHENIDFDVDSVIGRLNITPRTDNNLFGGQLGAQYACTWGAFRRIAEGKGGVFANEMSQRTRLDFGGVEFYNEHRNSSRISYLGQASLTGQYAFSEHWSIRGGYHALFIEGLALAPAQVPADGNFVPGTAHLDGNGGVFMHGASAGLQFKW